jgi:hypothetical protein
MSAPSNNEWRISGLLGIQTPTDPTQQETMLQGLGFPLRPVDNVPATTSPTFPDGLVAEGYAMQYMPNGYEEGKYYARGSVVTNGEWTMIATTLTLEYPYPLPDGNPTFSLPSFTPATQSNSSIVYSGNMYTFLEGGWIKTLRAWITQLTVDTNYRVVVITEIPGDDPVTTVFEEPVLTVGAWKDIAFLNQLIPVGTTMLIYVDALNSGADNEVTGGWNFTGQNNTGGPVAQAWNHDNANSIVRIDKTDLDGTDRTAELSGITTESTLVFADTSNPSAFNQYRVTGTIIDNGTYFSYPAVLQEQGEGGVPIGVSTLTATIPIPQPTEYAEEVATVPTPTWATAQGYLAFNGVEQPAGVNNSYGVDIEFEPAIVPTDWSVFSFNSL